jgi:hypothetical protein
VTQKTKLFEGDYQALQSDLNLGDVIACRPKRCCAQSLEPEKARSSQCSGAPSELRQSHTDADDLTRIAIESISPVGGGEWTVWSQATRFRVRDCDIDNGGIWIAEGSAQVEIINNRMTNGRGPSVAFRRLPPGSNATNSRDTKGATISDNSFTRFGDGAIVCGFDVNEGDTPGKVLDLKISNNLIENSAEAGARRPYTFPAVKAAGGTALIPIDDNFSSIEHLPNKAARCLFSSNDDILVSDNQFLSRDGKKPAMHILVGVSFVPDPVRAPTARVTGNRVRDKKDDFAIFSASPSSILASNQTRGSIISMMPGVIANNQDGV